MSAVVVLSVVAILIFKNEVISAIALVALAVCFIVWMFGKIAEHGNF